MQTDVREAPSAPGVSVIIPTYNAARFLPEALESVLAEATPEVEVLVVDDGSTDRTPELLAHYVPRVRSIRLTNGGPGRARNAGLAATRAPLVAFLDADDRWLPGSLRRRLVAIDAEPRAALVHGLARYVDADGRPMAFDPMAYRARRSMRRSGCVLRSLFWHNFIHTSTVIVRRAALEAIGGFDERREVIEDYDLWLRIAARWPVAFVPEAVAVYRCYAGSLGRSGRTRTYLGQLPALEGALGRGGLARTPLGRAWLRRRRLALLYADFADDLRWRGELGAAAAALGEALRLQPLAPRRAVMWAAMNVGPGALGALAAAVRMLRVVRTFRQPGTHRPSDRPGPMGAAAP